MTRPPTIPELPELLSQIPVGFGIDEAWKSSAVAVQINEYAKRLIEYTVQLREYHRARTAERLARRGKTDKGTARQRELQRLYSSTGLRELIWRLLEQLAVEKVPPTPHLLSLIALLDGPASANIHNLFKNPDAKWEPTDWKFYSAAQYIAQNVAPGAAPNAKEVAGLFKVDPRTIRRWLEDPEFRERAGLNPAAPVRSTNS